MSHGNRRDKQCQVCFVPPAPDAGTSYCGLCQRALRQIAEAHALPTHQGETLPAAVRRGRRMRRALES